MLEKMRDQRGGGGLAVGAGDGHRRLEAHELGQNLGAADDRQALLAGRLQLHIAVLDGRGEHHRLGPHQIDRVMADEDAQPLVAQAPHIGAVLAVRALHRVAQLGQDLGDGAHADAADADDVERPETGGHFHVATLPLPPPAMHCGPRGAHLHVASRPAPASASTTSARRATASGRPARRAASAARPRVSGRRSRRPISVQRRSGVSSA